MVDFQSRDRRRDDGRDSDDPADEEPEAAAEPTATDYDPGTVPFAVVTVADDRSIAEDETGDAVIEAIEAAGDAVSTRELIGSTYDGVQSTLGTVVKRADVDSVVTVGGTGIEPDDVTVDAASALFDKRLPGFGELFRVISHEQEGTAIVRTRATAGIIDGVPVFCLPGTTEGARRGLTQIVLEEAGVLAEQAAQPTADAD